MLLSNVILALTMVTTTLSNFLSNSVVYVGSMFCAAIMRQFYLEVSFEDTTREGRRVTGIPRQEGWLKVQWRVPQACFDCSSLSYIFKQAQYSGITLPERRQESGFSPILGKELE